MRYYLTFSYPNFILPISTVVQEIGSTLLLLHCSLDKSAISGTKPVGAVSKVQEKFIMQASADLLR